MKSFFALLFAILAATFVQAQNAVPNGNFEDWNTTTFQNPQTFFTSNADNFRHGGLPFNCEQTNDAQHGSYAVKLTTTAAGTDTSFGYMVDANPNNNFPNLPGGIAYNQKPTAITGYYKCSIVAGDTARVFVIFKKGGSNMVMYMYPLFGTHNSYTQFTFPFGPIPNTPDTIIVGFTSSDVANSQSRGKAGSWVQIDNVSFTGVSSQPADLNGDFENWVSQNVYIPASWYLQQGSDLSSATRTNDAAKGSFALELKTSMGDRNGNPAANASQAGTGYYVCPNNGGGQCTIHGGAPFNHINDTLVFNYKYTPSGNDSAIVNLVFKSGGTITDGRQMSLGASASYKYMEFPIFLGSAPDSVIVFFQSSSWNDTLVSYVGSDLKVDEVHFKSQPLNTGFKQFANANNSMVLYPNPAANGNFSLSHIPTGAVIRVFDILGNETEARISRFGDTASIHLATAGVYFVKVTTKEGTTTKRVVVK